MTDHADELRKAAGLTRPVGARHWMLSAADELDRLKARVEALEAEQAKYRPVAPEVPPSERWIRMGI